ncbi:MAG: hypothetical protein VXZ18_19365, partial [Pseudomonadota bacterium]|nr:hypothetical protein [Pseudomonadota bacterium]
DDIFNEGKSGTQHFIHITKTGGTSVAAAVMQCTPHSHGSDTSSSSSSSSSSLRVHDHDVGLWQLPRDGSEAVAVVREPVERFLSSFIFFKEGGFRGARHRRSDFRASREGQEALKLQRQVVDLLSVELSHSRKVAARDEDDHGKDTVMPWEDVGKLREQLETVAADFALLLNSLDDEEGRGRL